MKMKLVKRLTWGIWGIFAAAFIAGNCFAATYHTILCDGTTTEWQASDELMDTDSGDDLFITWSSTAIYISYVGCGFSGVDDDTGDGDFFIVIDTNPGSSWGSMTSVNWNNEGTHTLPFKADYSIGIDRDGNKGYHLWDGSGWVWQGWPAGWHSYIGWSGNNNTEIEIARTDIGNPNSIRILIWTQWESQYKVWSSFPKENPASQTGSETFTHYWRITSLVSGKNPNESYKFTSSTAPSAITDFFAVLDTGEGEIQLSWTAPGDDGTIGTATSYLIEYSTDNWNTLSEVSDFSPVPSPSASGTFEQLTVTGLSKGVTYYFRIKSLDEMSNVSDADFSTSPAKEIPPAAVTDLTSSGDYGKVNIFWTTPGDDGTSGVLSGKFEIRYSSTSTDLWADMTGSVEISTSVSPGVNVSCTVTGLIPLTSYYFYIKSYDERPNTSELSNKTTGFVLNSSPSSPYGFSQADLSSNSVSFNQWISTDVLKLSFSLSDPDTADRVKFNIVISSFSDFSFVFVNSTSTLLSQGTTQFITPLLVDGSWWWKVKAIDEHGAESFYSSATILAGEKHFGVDTAPPANVGCAKPVNNSFDLETSTSLTSLVAIDNFSGVYQYEIQVSTTSAFNGTGDQTSGWQSGNTFSPSLSGDTTYYWRVRVKDNVGNVSAYGASFSFVTASTPTAVQNFSGMAVSSYSINWFWDDASGEDGYRIINSTGGVLKTLSANTTFWLENSLTPNTSYYRTVVSYNVAGSSQSAPCVKFTLANPPISTVFSSVFSSSITITFQPNSNPAWTRWGIFLSTDSFASTSTLTNYSSNYTSTTYIASNLSSLTSYWFKVCAFNEDGIQTDFGLTISTLTLAPPLDETPPAVINDFSAQTGSREGEINLAWTSPGDDGTTGQVTSGEWRVDYSIYNKVWNVSEYRIKISTSFQPLTTHNLLLTGLTGGSTYYFRIWAADEVPNWSPVSNGATSYAQVDVTAPSVITDLSADSSDNKVYLAWTEPGDDGTKGVCSQFQIRYSTVGAITESNFSQGTKISVSPVQGGSGSRISETITGLTIGVRYWFAVKASDERGNYSVSNSPSVVVESDSTSPSAPSSFAAVSSSPGEVVISWTAPGDDGTTGTVSGYIVKYATYPITEANFNAAEEYAQNWEPVSGGSQESKTLDLTPAVTYYIAIKAYDENGNYSAISTVVVFVSISQATYLKKPVAAPNPATVEDGFVDLYFKINGEISNVSIKIYDLKGKEIFSVSNLSFACDGWTYYRWDFRDKSGDVVPSGIYLFRVQSRYNM